MKWLLKRAEPMALWEEDGDLERMNTFFKTLESDAEGKEQVKQSVKQKALEKLAKAEESEAFPVKQQNGFVQRMRVRLRSFNSTFAWKFSISIATLAILLIIGQGAMSGSWSIIPRMGSSEKLFQSTNMVAPEMAGSDRTKGKSPSSGIVQFGDMPESNGAGAEQKAASSYAADSSTYRQDLTILPVPPNPEQIPPADAGIPRKIIHDLSITLEVTKINDVVDLISREVQKLQGYVVSSQQSGVDDHSSAQLTVKIPADKLSVLRNSLATWGKVLDQRLFANDITNQYYDSQSRLKVLEVEEQRYLEIMREAKTVEDVLKVENALGNVRQQIEHLKGQLKLWNNQVDYSTVTLQLVTQQSPNFKVPDPWQPISWSSTWKATGDAVLKTLSSSWNALNYLIVGIGYASPYLLVGAIGWILYRIWKRRNM